MAQCWPWVPLFFFFVFGTLRSRVARVLNLLEMSREWSSDPVGEAYASSSHDLEHVLPQIVRLVSRLFYSDTVVVITDTLLEARRALTVDQICHICQIGHKEYVRQNIHTLIQESLLSVVASRIRSLTTRSPEAHQRFYIDFAQFVNVVRFRLYWMERAVRPTAAAHGPTTPGNLTSGILPGSSRKQGDKGINDAKTIPKPSSGSSAGPPDPRGADSGLSSLVSASSVASGGLGAGMAGPSWRCSHCASVYSALDIARLTPGPDQKFYCKICKGVALEYRPSAPHVRGSGMSAGSLAGPGQRLLGPRSGAGAPGLRAAQPGHQAGSPTEILVIPWLPASHALTPETLRCHLTLLYRLLGKLEHVTTVPARYAWLSAPLSALPRPPLRAATFP